MADYCTLATLKAALKMESTTADEDTRLAAVITAASRAVDAACNRVFFATTATRYFKADCPSELMLDDDLLEVSTLKTDEDGDRVYERTWAVTDYDLEPANAAPYTRILTPPRGAQSFPTTRRGVEVAGLWGYCATGAHPAPIEEATILQAIRLWKRAESPFGVLGTPETGVVRLPKLDADVKQLLSPYVKILISAA